MASTDTPCSSNEPIAMVHNSERIAQNASEGQDVHLLKFLDRPIFSSRLRPKVEKTHSTRGFPACAQVYLGINGIDWWKLPAEAEPGAWGML